MAFNRNLGISLGKKLLYYHGKGQKFSDSERRAARMLIEGTGTIAELNLVRAALGIQKSGSSAVRGFTRSIKSVSGDIGQISSAIQLSELANQTGNNVTGANLNLINVVTSKLEKVIKNKSAKEFITKAAEKLGSSPMDAANFYRAIGRGLKLGGAVIGVVSTGFAAAESYFTNQKQAAASISARRDMIRSFSPIDNTLATIEESRIKGAVLSERGAFSRLKDFFGMTGETEAEINKRLQQRLSILKEARTVVNELGFDKNTILAQYASKKGKTIADLRPDEINQAIDEGIKGALDPKKFSNDPYVQNIVDQQTNFGESVKHQLVTLFGLFGPDLATRYGQVRSAAELERVEKEIKTKQARKRDLHILANQERERQDATPGSSYKRREEKAFLESYFSNWRSRHKAIRFD